MENIRRKVENYIYTRQIEEAFDVLLVHAKFSIYRNQLVIQKANWIEIKKNSNQNKEAKNEIKQKLLEILSEIEKELRLQDYETIKDQTTPTAFLNFLREYNFGKPISRAIDSIENSIKELKKHIQKQEQELEKKLAVSVQDKEKVTKELYQEREEKSKLENQLKSSSLTDKKAENLKSEIKGLDKQIKHLTDELRDRQGEIDEMRAELKRLRSLDVTVAELREKNEAVEVERNRLKRENENLKQELKTIKAKGLSEQKLHQQIDALHRELAHYKKANEVLDKKQVQLKQELKAIEERLKQERIQVLELKSRLSEANNDFGKAKQTEITLTKQLDAKTKEVKKLKQAKRKPLILPFFFGFAGAILLCGLTVWSLPEKEPIVQKVLVENTIKADSLEGELTNLKEQIKDLKTIQSEYPNNENKDTKALEEKTRSLEKIINQKNKEIRQLKKSKKSTSITNKKLTIAIVSCNKTADDISKVWNAMATHNKDKILMLGPTDVESTIRSLGYKNYCDIRKEGKKQELEEKLEATLLIEI